MYLISHGHFSLKKSKDIPKLVRQGELWVFFMNSKYALSRSYCFQYRVIFNPNISTVHSTAKDLLHGWFSLTLFTNLPTITLHVPVTIISSEIHQNKYPPSEIFSGHSFAEEFLNIIHNIFYNCCSKALPHSYPTKHPVSLIILALLLFLLFHLLGCWFIFCLHSNTGV